MITKIKQQLSDKDSREKLLYYAEFLFAEHGYDAVSLRTLQQESGINIAMISYYFGSKEGLFEAMLTEKFPLIREKLDALKSSQLTFLEKIESTIEIYSDRMFESVNFTKIIFREMSMTQRPDHNKLIIDYIRGNLDVILSFINDGIRCGEFRSVDPEMTLCSLIATIVQWINMSPVSIKMMKEKKNENLYTTKYKIRLQTHLKDMMKRHLIESY